ncbi:hypothetical protein FV218_14010 [Methylobacterium sp. WL69]|uniref:hypothetical protein n=1 Tax=Methylobacterium sp. WL69 TaxID=2603893 RepID=UPI0011C93C7C|nr:hypothetical protein [Methylobacterium sp. WL69]TXM72096.1 hypothetical protein FV218_14010 [Methylobacterium sp. WL69]
MRRLLTAGLLVAALTAPALAQTAPPDAAAPEPRPPETKAERQRNSAAKLAGLLYFVQNACPDLKPDYARFKDVVASLGVTMEDLSAGDLLLRSRAYTEVYTKDTPGSCARADTNFGAAGSTIPNLVVKRTAP